MSVCWLHHMVFVRRRYLAASNWFWSGDCRFCGKHEQVSREQMQVRYEGAESMQRIEILEIEVAQAAATPGGLGSPHPYSIAQPSGPSFAEK